MMDKVHLHREPATIEGVLGAPGVLRPPVEVELVQLVGVVQGAAAHHPHTRIQREVELLDSEGLSLFYLLFTAQNIGIGLSTSG